MRDIWEVTNAGLSDQWVMGMKERKLDHSWFLANVTGMDDDGDIHGSVMGREPCVQRLSYISFWVG